MGERNRMTEEQVRRGIQEQARAQREAEARNGKTGKTQEQHERELSELMRRDEAQQRR